MARDSKGAKNSSALPPTKNGALIREQNGPIDSRLRHSMQVPDTKNHFASVFPGKDNPQVTLEDSMISAGSSSLGGDGYMDSVPEYVEEVPRTRHKELAFKPPKTEWRKNYNSKRRTHTLDARYRNQKFLSNSELDNLTGTKIGYQNRSKDPAGITCPAIDGSKYQYDPRRANNTVQAISNRNNQANKPGYLAAHTVREIEKRDHRKMRARLPAY